MSRILLTAALAALSMTAKADASFAQGGRYVSMGSSYAAGPGVGRPDPASGDCARSLSNYARRVAARRGLDLVDVACSGATTDNILVRGQFGFPAQIMAVTPDTRLISVLIGGNDVDYVGNLFAYTCRAKGGPACGVVPPQAVARRFAGLSTSLDQVVREIRRRAPAARIVLVGYLPVIPAAGSGVCPSLPLSPADAARMRKVAVDLDEAISDAATRTHLGLVRSWSVGAGHDACSAEPFVAGNDPPETPGWGAPIAYHPNQAGMDRIADALETVLTQPTGP